MKLYIAEKPSLARAIIAVLPKPHKKYDGYLESSNGDIVTWCIGHLLEQAPPDDYNPDYKKWQIEHLPIVPTQWKLKPKVKTRKQLSILKQLIKKSDQLVNAGDADREGQILVDEAISFCGANKFQIDNALRCLISDLNYEAVFKSVNHLKPNKDYLPLAVSALSRARADWLYGLNMTRLCTIQGQKSGYKGVLSIGRVQTPILALVVNRDSEIENFTAKPFYEVIAQIKTKDNQTYQAKWKPSKACQPYMDEEKRVLVKALAANVAKRIYDQPGKITNVTKQEKQQPAPLLFSLSALQIAAAKKYGMSAKQVLDICQQLYEKHKLITYPRSDCQYLPTEHFQAVPAVINAIKSVKKTLSQCIDNADLRQKNRVWNDTKVGAHHAIIPTANSKLNGLLTSNEEKIYALIARQYIAQFYPNFVFCENQIDTEIAGGLFISKQKDILKIGWKAVLNPTNHEENTDHKSIPLPRVITGNLVHCFKAEVLEKMTSAPKHFTDATLLAALTGISRYVTNSDIKKILKETDGLGTEATRAGIIELLFKRNYLNRKGKEIYATEIGKQLITALPLPISQPDMTALWESQLNAISCQTLNYQSFINGIENNLTHLINEVKNIDFVGLPTTSIKNKFTKKRPVKKAKQSY